MVSQEGGGRSLVDRNAGRRLAHVDVAIAAVHDAELLEAGEA